MDSIELFVPVANKNMVSHDGKLPWWNLPRFIEYFKSIAVGHVVVVDYSTLIAISEAVNRHKNLLPGCELFVLTNDAEKIARFTDCTLIPNIDAVINLGRKSRVIITVDGDLSRRLVFLPEIRVIHCARIIGDHRGDSNSFPKLSDMGWEIVASVSHSVDEKNHYATDFIKWVRSSKEKFIPI